MSQSISNPVRVAVVYHSGYGHTAKHAEAVARGAAASQDTKCVLIRVEEVDLQVLDVLFEAISQVSTTEILAP